MPPRGHHEQQLPASQTDKHGNRPGTVREAPGSTGFGLTPENVGKYFANPANDPANNFRPTYEKNKAAINAGGVADYNTAKAAWEQKQREWDAKTERMRANAQALAAQYNQRATALRLEAAGKSNYTTQRIAGYYGLDTKSKKGRQAARDWAGHLETLASAAATDKDGSGVRGIVHFDKLIHSTMQTERHNAFVKEQAAYAKAEDIGSMGILDRVKLGLGGDVQAVADTGIFDWANRSFSAGKYAELHGANLRDQIAAELGSLPGASGLGLTDLWAPKGSDARDYIDKTATTEQRDKLTKHGHLLSFGESVTGQYGGLGIRERKLARESEFINSLPPETRARFRRGQQAENEFFTTSSGVHLNSGAIDAVFNIAEDPTLAFGKGFEAIKGLGDGVEAVVRRSAEQAVKDGAEKATEEALAGLTRQVREHIITSTTIGQNVVRESVEKLGSMAEPNKIAKYLGPDAPRALVSGVIDAGARGGKEEVQAVLEHAFATGAWNPERTLVERFALRHSETLGKAVLPRVTETVAKALGPIRHPLTAIIDLGAKAAPTFMRAPLSSGNVDNVLRWAVDHAAIINKQFGGDIIQKFMDSHIFASPADRIVALKASADVIENPGFVNIVDEIGKPLLETTFDKMAPAAQQELMNRIEHAETVLAILGGDAGVESQQMVRDGLLRQYSLTDIPKDATTTVKNVVESIKGRSFNPAEYAKVDPADAQYMLEQGLPEGTLKNTLAEELAAAKPGSKQLANVAEAIDLAVDSPGVFEEVTRQLELHGERFDIQEALRSSRLMDGPSLAQRFLGGGARLLRSVQEKVPAAVLRTGVSPYAGENQRNMADFFTRWIDTLGLPAVQRTSLYRDAERVARDVAGGADAGRALEFHGKLVEIAFEANGLDRDIAREWATAAQEDLMRSVQERPQAFGVRVRDGVDPTGQLTAADYELLNRPQVGSQAQSIFIVGDYERVAEGIRKQLTITGQGSKFNNIRVWFDEDVKAFAINIGKEGLSFGEKATGHTFYLRNGIHGAIRFWKVMVTTKMYLPLFAVGASLAVGNDAWTTLAIGSAAAGLGLVRYRARMSIQNRIAAVESHGFVPQEWIPGRGFLFRRAERPVYGSGINALFPNPEDAAWIENRFGFIPRGGESQWEVVTAGGSKSAMKDYAEAYHRVLNFQINPETDEVMRLMLLEKGGKLKPGEYDELLDEFLRSDDGAAWMDKQRGMSAAGLKEKQAVKRYQEFVDRFVPNADVANARMDPNNAFGVGNSITHDQIRAMAEQDLLSDAVHFQRSESFLKQGKVYKMFAGAYEAAAYDSAKNAGFRETFFATERKGAEAKLIRNGMAPKEARELAGEIATRRTNEIMFRYDNVSRFAHKVDWIAPFTGHRLFNIQTWAKLALDNPGRSIRLFVHGAQAFNAGVESGIFHQDQYGSWQMNIPGSAPLSRVMGISNTNFDFNLSGLTAMTGELDRASSGGPLGIAETLLPHPGGPWWAATGAAVRAIDPEIFDKLPSGVKDFLYPYGPQAGILTPDAARYMRLIVGTGGPWSMLDDDQGTAEVDKMEVQLVKTAIAEYRAARLKDHPGIGLTGIELDWTPDPKDIREQALAMFHTMTMVGNLFPASPHPKYHTQEKFQEHWDAWLGPLAGKSLPKGEFGRLRKSFVNRYPAYAPFLDSSSMWRGGDSHDDWVHSNDQRNAADYNMEKFLGERGPVSMKEYLASFAKFRKIDRANQAFSHAMEIPDSLEREKAMVKYRHDFPEEAKYFHNHQNAERDLARIYQEYPHNQIPQAIERWRHHWADPGQQTISRNDFEKMKANIKKNEFMHRDGQYHLDPWKRARDSETVWDNARKATGHTSPLRKDGTINPAWAFYAASLGNPAERIKLWQQALMHLETDVFTAADGFGETRTKYETLKKQISEVYKTEDAKLHPKGVLHTTKADTSYNAMVDAIADKSRKSLNDLRDQKKTLQTSMNTAAQSKQWSTFYALKAQQDDVKKAILKVQNDWWGGKPVQSKQMHEAVRELTFLMDSGSHDKVAIAEAWTRVQKASSVPFQPSDEEAHVLSMPPTVKQAYINDLVHELNLPPGEGSERFKLNQAEAFAVGADGVGAGQYSVSYKVYWEHLTDFQKKLLEDNLPTDITDGYKATDQATSEARAKAATGSGRGGRGGGGSDLSWAFAQMKKYSKRGGMAKPAGYDAYLAIGNNPAARNQYLEDHPDVAAYVKAGPMSNMPPVIAMMVQQTMIENGKWEGEPMDMGQLTDIAFAREQLQRYNKRTGPAPATYDLWLNMPTGQAKADYILQHPEIKAWLQLGPMANMPEMYRDVVRDIMYRYHEWTASSDGMGDVLSGYYRTPTYARTQYLAQHPELAAYWQATRSPQDEAMGQLVDSYYATPDPGAKAAMLAAHPELKQYFMDSRTRRYERFLNQVAQYMGGNPDLFQHYLDDQNRIMGDLLNKFAVPNLAREEHWMKPTKASTKSAEGGRARS